MKIAGAAHLRMFRHADSADIVSVAERKKRKHGDCSMFDRMNSTHEVEFALLNCIFNYIGNLNPYSDCFKMNRRQVQRHDADQVLSLSAAFLVGSNLLGDLQSGFSRGKTGKFLRAYRGPKDFSLCFGERPSVVSKRCGFDQDILPFQIKLCNQILFGAVEVNRTLMTFGEDPETGRLANEGLAVLQENPV